jgi:hypothetical protein
VCIGSRNETISSRRFLTWPSIVRYLRLEVAPTVLKMDIKGTMSVPKTTHNPPTSRFGAVCGEAEGAASYRSVLCLILHICVHASQDLS